MKWLNSLPSPIRHALIALATLEAAVLVNGFAGAETWPDIKTAALAIPAALAVGFVRWATQQLSSVEPPAARSVASSAYHGMAETWADAHKATPCYNCDGTPVETTTPEQRNMMPNASVRARNFGPYQGVMQVTLNREQHELLTQPVSDEEAASPAPLVYHGGKLINQGRGRIFNVHLGAGAYDAVAFDEFAKAVCEGGYYRSPDGTDTTPAKFLGSKKVAWPPGWSQTVTDAQIQAWVDLQVLQGGFPAQDGYTQYMLMFPPNTTVLAFNESSCAYFCGYHNKTARGNYYSVQDDTSCAGCHGAFSPLAGMQMVYAHEYGEFRSDPDGDGWTVDQAGNFRGWENGDLCAWKEVAYGPAEKQWFVQPLATNDLGCYAGAYVLPTPQVVTTALAMLVQPRNAIVGIKALDFSVQLLDATGAMNVEDSSSLVTLTLPGFPDTQTVKAINGVCLFAGEVFKNVHSQITYHFASGALTGINSAPFDVTAAPTPPPSSDSVSVSPFDVAVVVNGKLRTLHVLGGSI